MPEDSGILSPFQPRGPRPPIVKHVDVEMHEFSHKNGFMHDMAVLALIIVGVAASGVEHFYTEGLPALAANIAFISWTLASVKAIVEHSKENEKKVAQKQAQQFINEQIKKFTNHGQL